MIPCNYDHMLLLREGQRQLAYTLVASLLRFLTGAKRTLSKGHYSNPSLHGYPL